MERIMGMTGEKETQEELGVNINYGMFSLKSS
jgi:hypothetical protein